MGGKRGRLIPCEDRALAVELIEEAKMAGARIFKACEVLEISVRTFKRWKTSHTFDRRKGAAKTIPRRLSNQEQDELIRVCCQKTFQDLTPYEIQVILLDSNIYMASVSTMYRVLRKRNMIHFRGNTRKGYKTHRPPEREATGPNQVWAWDITYLKSPIAGIYFFLYTVIDVWSKKIVGWKVATKESYEISEDLFQYLMKKYQLKNVYLHSDNGNPMKAGTMIMTLYKLGIIPSYSRPRVSNDNPFIESFFRSLKYMKSYPKYFESINKANDWVANFMSWYNERHLHSSIGYVTPEQKHAGKADAIIEKRNVVKRQAYLRLKCRWSKPVAQLPNPKTVILNPSLERLEAKAS